jgi:hypothetical protein
VRRTDDTVQDCSSGTYLGLAFSIVGNRAVPVDDQAVRTIDWCGPQERDGRVDSNVGGARASGSNPNTIAIDGRAHRHHVRSTVRTKGRQVRMFAELGDASVQLLE